MKIVRYFFVGGAAAAVDFAVFAALVKSGALEWFFAAIISFTLATCVNYVLSVRHVFQSGARFGKQKEIALVFLVSGIGLAINQAILYLLIQRVGIDALLSKIAATGVVFFWNFAARSRFIFSTRGQRA